MTKIENFVEGLQILVKYEQGYCIIAEHDQFWAVGTDKTENMPEEEKKRLEELGWFVDEDSWSIFI